MIYCWHCNSSKILVDPTGWICTQCGQHGADSNPILGWQNAGLKNVPYCKVGEAPCTGPLMEGKYIGKIKHLKDKTAIVRVIPDFDDLYAVQLHDVNTGLGYGWHAFRKEDWEIVNEQSNEI